MKATNVTEKPVGYFKAVYSQGYGNNLTHIHHEEVNGDQCRVRF
jgi:hypothetical protein